MDLLAKAQTFVRIVEAGSFSAAGRGLGLSLPAISRQVSALEQELSSAKVWTSLCALGSKCRTPPAWSGKR